MKILFIHNKYGKYSGEEAVVDCQMNLFKEYGHQVISYFRSSSELKGMPVGKIKAFFTALYNPSAIRQLKKILIKEKPDVVHVHNLFPLISPSILPVIKRFGVPIVMTVHNYRLICPNGLFYNKKKICENCSKGREWNCIINNCEKSLFKSIGYALRNWLFRVNKYYLNNISCFACLTDFQRTKLVLNGFPASRTEVVPNMFRSDAKVDKVKHQGNYMAVVGRISPEKGIHVLLESARLLPCVLFKLAGSVRNGYISSLDIPENVELVGELESEQLCSFYSKAKALIHSSLVYEGFPMVFPEAMNYNLPIIAPRMAGYPEIVEDGHNGLLFEPGDSMDLAKKILELWEDNEKCQIMGENGHIRMIEEFSQEVYYKKLMLLYNRVLLG